MTSSNGNIFRVTGHLCGEFTGPGEFSTQRPVTRSFDVYFDLRPNKWLSKQSWGWWFETLSCPLWRHRNDMSVTMWRFESLATRLFDQQPVHSNNKDNMKVPHYRFLCEGNPSVTPDGQHFVKRFRDAIMECLQYTIITNPESQSCTVN